MSGITGISLRDNGCIDQEMIKKMNDVLMHRGPDGLNVWNRGSIALGHQMLCTTPESLNERLPFYDEKNKLAITADARIDNREDLIKELKIPGLNKDVSDSQLILKSYEKWGENCPERLLGDFAFVIWDGEKNLLFCARDHMGVKPFYYYISDELFTFASEIKALIKLPEVPVKLNKTRIAHFLTYLFEDREITFYENIFRLPAASKLTVTTDSFKLEKYWKLDYRKKIILESDREYSEIFLKIFKEAVKCRLRSVFPVGSMLSGGLDSSSIVCTAREILLRDGGDPLKTFSLIFEETPQSDESLYINFVLDKGFLTPYKVNADDYSPVFNLDPVLWNENGAFFAYNIYFNYLLYDLAHNSNTRIILDGLGGDITVSHGTGLLIDLVLENQWKEFYREVKGTSERFAINFYKLLGYQLFTVIKTVILNKLKFKGGNINYLYRESEIINKDFLKKSDIEKQLESFPEKQLKYSKKSLENHYNSLNSGMIQYVLEEADRLSAAFSVEPRYPFFDVRLIEFCLALPPYQKRSYGWDRLIMRNAMFNILPTEVQWRKNKMYGVDSAIKNFITLDKEFIEDIIRKDHQLIDEYVDVVALHKSYEKFLKRKDSHTNYDIWGAVALGLWLRNSFIQSKK